MKLLCYFSNKQTGETQVTLVNKNGAYVGKAKLHQEDKEYYSRFCGCRLAEKRAWLKYLITECRRKKIMLNTIRNLNKDIQSTCKDIIPKKVQRRINLKLRDYNKEIMELNTDINTLKTEIKKDIEIRDNLIKRSKTNNKPN